MKDNYPILYKELNRYIELCSASRINSYLMILELFEKGMNEEEIINYLQRETEKNKTVWTLQPGDTCFIIKETGEIIETTYKDEDYFKNVKKYGNLATTRQRAEVILKDRTICIR